MRPSTWRSVARISLALLSAGAAGRAQDAQSAEQICAAHVAAARARAGAGDAEGAAQCLRAALRAAEQVVPAVKGSTLRNQVLAAMRKSDPRWKERAAGGTEVANLLIALSARYRARAWNQSAFDLLSVADELDPKLARKPLAEIEAAGFKPRQAAHFEPPMGEWFRDAMTGYSEAKWTIEADRVLSPRLDATISRASSTILMPGRAPRAEEFYIEIEALLPAQGHFGLMFASQDEHAGTFALVRRSLEEGGAESGAISLQLAKLAESEFEILSKRSDRLTKREREQPVRLRVEARRSGVRARLVGLPWIEVPAAPLVPRGRMGLYVPGDSACREPLEFRALALGELAPGAPR